MSKTQTRSLNLINYLIFTLSALCALAIGIIGINVPAVGAETEIAQGVTLEVVDESAQTTVAPEDLVYHFVAEPCDSLTKLVRRALLTYDEANPDVKLSKPGIIYAETNIVQKMGAYLLDVGDEVSIDGADIVKFASRSTKLSESQIAAWQVYVPSVDFDLETIQQPSNRQEIEDTVAEDADTGQAPTSADETAEDTDDSAAAGWWFAGIAVAAVVWYLLWRRQDEEEDFNSFS